MARWVRLIAFAGAVLATSSASATPCKPLAQLSGDPALVSTVGELLARHGVGTEDDGCPVVRARVDYRGSEIVVVREGEPPEERLVTEPATAATVIESWGRNDFESPLLAVHPLASSPALALEGSAETATQIAPYVPRRGVQVFGSAETSLADDRTTWIGGMVGVCVQLGRLCASARGRFATVADGPGMWSEIERHATDVLFGGDIPFVLGTTTLSVGFGAGMGAVHTGTHVGGVAEGSETFGLRADAHLAWAIRLGHRLSLDLSAAIDVSQVTDVEGSSNFMVANEPRIFGRLGAGLRFGVP